MSVDPRPDPDELLARVQAEEARARRGKLRIFFGATAGIGKTFAMLAAARTARAAGADIVIGYIEPHGRLETEQLMVGLELLPTAAVRYRDVVRHELNLDAALARRPMILLVDELAHSNVVGGEPPPRHPKRWQDIDELRDAGITVWTTVNVQHLESLNDLVAQITGARQRETVPDRVFDEADEVELIDLPPEDLLARLKAGKVYLAEEARLAADRFFRLPNLIALRELALRRTTSRVEAAARASLAGDLTSREWLARERLVVAIGPDSQAEQLVRSGKRIADALTAEWTVVYVETPWLQRLSEAERNRRIDLLRLAESLGAETVTLDGARAGATVAAYAEMRKATRVIVGSSKRRGWRALWRTSTTTELVRLARAFDVVTIAATGDTVAGATRRGGAETLAQPLALGRYAWAVAISLICSAVAAAMYPYFELSNLVMVYLLGVTVAGLRVGRKPSVVTALLNVLLFDYLFVPPRFSIAITDAQYAVTFGVMLTVALVIATLMASVRQQTRVAGARERRTALLYGMSRELAATRDTASIARVGVKHVAEVFQSSTVVLLPRRGGALAYPREAAMEGSFRGADLAVAQWVLDHGRRAGLGSDTLPAAPALYLPLTTGRETHGVLAVMPGNRRRVLLPEQRNLLETFAGQIALALERARLAEDAEAARVAAEAEGLRNTLLASISHDLRTPLAVIAGASSALAERGAALDESTRVALARSIETKAREMSELVANVLDLMRLDSGQVALRRSVESVEDLLGAALQQHEHDLEGHPVEVLVPADLPAVYVDAALVVQLFGNLFDNACKYTPVGTRLQFSAVADGDFVRVALDDDGPGLPPGEPEELFAKFRRGAREGAVVGVGLGLAICRAIVVAHGGTIEAKRRPERGARFELTLPAAEAGA